MAVSGFSSSWSDGLESVEARERFAVEDDRAGEHAALYVVARGSEFAFGSDGAARSGAVGARGRFLLFGCHGDLRDYVTSRKTGNRSVAGLSCLFCAQNKPKTLETAVRVGIRTVSRVAESISCRFRVATNAILAIGPVGHYPKLPKSGRRQALNRAREFSPTSKWCRFSFRSYCAKEID
jgi:hypothetical protein